MASSMEGTITIVQEGRFQLIDDAGVAHLFILAPNASAETEQLRPLERDSRRVRVRYSQPHNIIGNLATQVATLG